MMIVGAETDYLSQAWEPENFLSPTLCASDVTPPAQSQKPGQARPFNRLELAFGPAQIFTKPEPGAQAVAFSYQEWPFEFLFTWCGIARRHCLLLVSAICSYLWAMSQLSSFDFPSTSCWSP